MSIRVDHDLSAPTAFNFDNDDRDHTAFVKRSLTLPEFQVVSRARRSVPHAELLKDLRAAALSYGWDFETLDVLGHLLKLNGVLTPDVAQWLADAGPAWNETRRSR